MSYKITINMRDNKVIELALRNATNNFEDGYTISTLMGWTTTYDDDGRLTTPDPNYHLGVIKLGRLGIFTIIKHKWLVSVYGGEINGYITEEEPLFIVDLTPDYLKPSLSNHYVQVAGQVDSNISSKVTTSTTSVGEWNYDLTPLTDESVKSDVVYPRLNEDKIDFNDVVVNGEYIIVENNYLTRKCYAKICILDITNLTILCKYVDTNSNPQRYLIEDMNDKYKIIEIVKE